VAGLIQLAGPFLDPWLEAPDQFTATLRAAVKRQIQTAGGPVSDTRMGRH